MSKEIWLLSHLDSCFKVSKSKLNKKMFISVYSIDDEVVPPYGGEMNLYGNSLSLKKFILTLKKTEHYRYKEWADRGLFQDFILLCTLTSGYKGPITK